MPIVGTAGHVDHGKSTLVQALTGRDPDRWDEEKRRGLTIDLGFAWAELPGGTEVGFVDVPGHERFMKNMLAGVDGIDVALFVVAADEGWMPQSEEHLAVLDLLGVAHGVVALTRVDLVDADLAELATLEIHEHLAGTSLAGAPVLPVAAPAGRGVDDVAAALADAVRAAPAPPDRGRPRLWVDRSFVVEGAGTVLTGTLTGGRLAVGDQVEVWPGARAGRIRSIQSHERALEAVGPGNRTAVNVVGLDRREAARGAMLGAPDQWRATRRALVELRAVRNLPEPLGDRGAYHFHVGSGSWPGRLRVIADEPVIVALVRFDAELPLAAGDRVVVREVGRQAVVAGGVVLDPAPAGRGPAMRQAAGLLRDARGSGPDATAAALLETRGRAALSDLACDSGGGRPDEAAVADGVAFSGAALERLAAAARGEVDAYHAGNPLRPGIPAATLASRLGLTLSQLTLVVGRGTELEVDGSDVRRAGFSGGWGTDEQAAWEAARAQLAAAGPAAPRASQLGLENELLHALLRRGDLVRVADDLVYLPSTLGGIEEAVTGLADGFTVAEFRDLLGISRRQAVPLVEWFDRTGVTVREGDTRRVRRPPPRGPALGADPPR